MSCYRESIANLGGMRSLVQLMPRHARNNIFFPTGRIKFQNLLAVFILQRRISHGTYILSSELTLKKTVTYFDFLVGNLPQSPQFEELFYLRKFVPPTPQLKFEELHCSLSIKRSI